MNLIAVAMDRIRSENYYWYLSIFLAPMHCEYYQHKTAITFILSQVEYRDMVYWKVENTKSYNENKNTTCVNAN